jgi:hypothetical protein
MKVVASINVLVRATNSHQYFDLKHNKYVIFEFITAIAMKITLF